MKPTDRIADPWGVRTPYPAGGEWPARVDTYLGDGLAPEQVQAWVRSASITWAHPETCESYGKDLMGIPRRRSVAALASAGM